MFLTETMKELRPMVIRPKAGKFLLLILVLFFAAGMVRLFSIRFDVGDTYPEYSSLRADPFGTKIFYETLSGIKGVEVGRNFQPIRKINSNEGTTLFYFGTALFLTGEIEEIRELGSIAEKGGRIVMLLHPQENFRPKEKKGLDQESPKNKVQKEPDLLPIEALWGFKMESLKEDQNGQNSALVLPDQPEKLPVSVPWLSRAYFQKTAPEWRKIYSKKGFPVFMERSWGKGTLVVASDTYFVSNEAMVVERFPDLLSWLIGPNRKVIFDETHFGLADQPGIISLVRKYRLMPFLAALLFVSGLIFWKQSQHLVPPLPEEEEVQRARFSEGKDDLAGFSGLLKKNIPPSEILTACSSEWKKESGLTKNALIDQSKKIEWLTAEEKNKKAKERTPVKTYNTICKILKERNRFHE